MTREANRRTKVLERLKKKGKNQGKEQVRSMKGRVGRTRMLIMRSIADLGLSLRLRNRLILRKWMRTNLLWGLWSSTARKVIRMRLTSISIKTMMTSTTMRCQKTMKMMTTKATKNNPSPKNVAPTKRRQRILAASRTLSPNKKSAEENPKKEQPRQDQRTRPTRSVSLLRSPCRRTRCKLCRRRGRGGERRCWGSDVMNQGCLPLCGLSLRTESTKSNQHSFSHFKNSNKYYK